MAAATALLGTDELRRAVRIVLNFAAIVRVYPNRERPDSPGSSLVGLTPVYGRREDRRSLFLAERRRLTRVIDAVENDADESAHFCIYAFSDQALTDALKYKWEASTSESTGTLTGFTLQGVFESGYWNQYWSASMEVSLFHKGATSSERSTESSLDNFASHARRSLETTTARVVAARAG